MVWVVEAGGALFGTELCSWGCVAGRVAVADGGELDCAFAASTLKRKTPASSDTASVVVVAFIGLAPLRSMKTVCATQRSVCDAVNVATIKAAPGRGSWGCKWLGTLVSLLVNATFINGKSGSAPLTRTPDL